MPGTTVPAQMFNHELNAVKGWPSPYGLDKSGPIDPATTGILKGMCCSLNSSGNFIRGCPNGAMPIFAIPNQSDFDVDSDYGNISGGNLMGLVAVGSFELQTTEYSGTGFGPNIPLISPATQTSATVGANTGSTGPGLLVATVIGNATDTIVGICSTLAPFTNEFGKLFLQFWPVFIPKRG